MTKPKDSRAATPSEGSLLALTLAAATRDKRTVSVDPDKYRLPIDTSLIPYSFGTARGW